MNPFAGAASTVPARMTSAPPMLYNLEALRGICALMVALLHMPWTSSLFQFGVVRNAWLFVDFFFVLSGFILARGYASRAGDFDIAMFLVRRFFRLYPLHIATLIVVLALAFGRDYLLPAFSRLPPQGTFDEEFGLGLASNVLLAHCFGLTSRPYLNTPSWSIAAEFWTYVTFATICWRFPSVRTRILVLAAIACMSLVLLEYQNYPRGLFATFDIGILRCLAGFGLGATTWLIVHRWPRWPHWVIDVIFAATGIAIWYLMSCLTIETPHNAIILPFFAIVVGIFSIDNGSLTKKLLESRPMLALGRWSYSIYMVHAFWTSIFGFTVNRFYTAKSFAPHTLGKVELPLLQGEIVTLAYVATVLATSAITYRMIEQPWRRFGYSLASQHRSATDNSRSEVSI